MALLLPTSFFYILGLFNSYVSCLPGKLIAGAPPSTFRDGARSRSSPFRSHLRLFDLIELFAGAVQRCLPPRQQRRAPSSPAQCSGPTALPVSNELVTAPPAGPPGAQPPAASFLATFSLAASPVAAAGGHLSSSHSFPTPPGRLMPAVRLLAALLSSPWPACSNFIPLHRRLFAAQPCFILLCQQRDPHSSLGAGSCGGSPFGLKSSVL